MALFGEDIEQVILGDVAIPGIYESMEIGDDVKEDETEIEGKPEKSTRAVGYNPTRVTLSLRLVSDDEGRAYEKLQVIQALYRESLELEVPPVYRLANPHTQARGIEDVVLASLRSRDSNLDDTIMVSMELTRAAAVQIAVTTKATAGSTKYVIQSGDTLSAIARKFGTTVQALVDANNIADANLIYTGDTLVIPGAGGSGSTGGSGTGTSGASGTGSGESSASWTDADIGDPAADDDPPPVVVGE